MRTAFFLGVDVVAMTTRGSATVTPVALKASAGAAEVLPLVTVSKAANFVDNCKQKGWKIYAAVPRDPEKSAKFGKSISASELGCPTRDHPCLLILGGEGAGLHWDLRLKASVNVTIDGQRFGQGKVDSLNVSVAAGLLCEAFLRKPAGLLDNKRKDSPIEIFEEKSDTDDDRLF